MAIEFKLYNGYGTKNQPVGKSYLLEGAKVFLKNLTSEKCQYIHTPLVKPNP